MSFDPRFDNRYNSVIEPGLRAIEVNGESLEPVRVNVRSISDSILTEILSGIGQSRLVFADVSTIGTVEGRPIRNGNVMYEVGIAHAIRQPEEVLLFRSDDDEILFDVANVRINRYSPDTEPDNARKLITQKCIESLRELDLKKNLSIQRAADSLDDPSWMLLIELQSTKKMQHPKANTLGNMVAGLSRTSAIQSLLNIGAIKSTYYLVTPEALDIAKDNSDSLLSYECTDFGAALFSEGVQRMGMDDPKVLKMLEERARNESKD